MNRNIIKRNAIEKINSYIDFFKNYDEDVLPKRLVITDLQSIKRTLEKEYDENETK